MPNVPSLYRALAVLLGFLGVAAIGRAQPAHDRSLQFVVVTDASGRTQAVMASHERSLVRIDARTGTVEWRTLLPSESSGGPLIVGETAVVQGCSGGYCLYGFDVQTGRLKWTLDGSSGDWHRLLRGRAVDLATDGRWLFLTGRFSEGVVALDPRTAKPRWRALAGRPVSTMVPIGERLLTDAGVVDIVTGRTLRLFAAREVAAADSRDGLLVMASADGLVSRVDPRTLAQIWKRRIGPFDGCQVLATNSVVATMGVSGEVLVSMDGHLEVFDAASGASLWDTVIRTTGLISRHVLSGDRDHVYVTFSPNASVESGQIVAYGARDGREEWSYHFETTAPVDGVVSRDGLVYLHDGEVLTALDSQSGRVRWQVRLTASR